MKLKTLWDTYSAAGAIVDLVAQVRAKAHNIGDVELKAIEEQANSIKSSLWPELNQAIAKTED